MAPTRPRPAECSSWAFCSERLLGSTHQQRYQQRNGQQSCQALPELERGALIKRARSANFDRRARRTGLYLECEFGHVAKALGRIERNRALQHRLKPGRKIRAQRGKV